ncbi:metallophosphoesterase [Runella slithyformis]|uniref:Metallophosphoesterase n=1 Tax=Runella slithyformis (strain ATCC 29530 / DSM 19594 / LMG 11500 / NCIMB 11436 / LSU 4) TaxID=761193 RepID=A0A7U3ZIL0_RUNSL|nr:metallophosphoesterase [Runella slithyformis]AEI47895.1 metallophosphoesterase [Runella slithyformis DSM 19594]
MKRTLVIGDIHGGLRALRQVLERAQVQHDDTLIFLGDYVDGWSESAQVIEFLIQLSSQQSCLFMKGNHDMWCENWLDNGLAPHVWLMHGGSSTAESYRFLDMTTRRKHLDFFNQLKSYHIDAQNRLFVHAGFASIHGPEDEHDDSNFLWDRTLWETALTMERRSRQDDGMMPKRLKLFREIFIGHTPTLNYNLDVPMHASTVWNIDTGAAFYGKLSIMDIDTKEFWQSDTVQRLYPDEKGRN